MDEVEAALALSSWFTRGWTLQELIAPREVILYDQNWIEIHRKSTSAKLLSRITGIDQDVLSGADFRQLSIAVRMSWAARRVTTRLEDQAYSLLGLFGVNMPLLYGEGTEAFRRLQEEIIKGSTDHSIFAWGMTLRSLDIESDRHVLAASPRAFVDSKEVIAFNPRGPRAPFALTNAGLQLNLPTGQSEFFENNGVDYVLINCRLKSEPLNQLAIPLCQHDWRHETGVYSRMPMVLRSIRPMEQGLFKHRAILMTPFYPLPDHDQMYGNGLKFYIRSMPSRENGFTFREVYPPSAWNPNTLCLSHPERITRRSVTWRALMRFETPDSNELLVSFQKSPDRGGPPVLSVTVHCLKDSRDVMISDLCEHTSEYHFVVRHDKLSHGFPGVFAHSETSFWQDQMFVLSTSQPIGCNWRSIWLCWVKRFERYYYG